jgi:polysaccharide chain length determinant protein (PEP-CTERM system associated)
MISRKLLTTDEYLEIALRRIWWIIIPVVLAMAGAAVYAKFCPRTYLASTTILVTPQKVPVDYVRPTVTSKIEDRLHSIRQEIMSRTRLEKIISEFNLYPQEGKKLSSEEIVELMRKDIIVTIGGKEGYFTLSYKGRDPDSVTKVTNRLASLFVEENLRLREQQAQGTTEFLSLELNATKAKLEEQEKILTDYKQKHLYDLPDRVATNLGVLNQLRQDQQRVSTALNSALERKLVIQKQIAEIQKQAAEIKSAAAPPGTPEVKKEDALPQDAQPASAPGPPRPADTPKQKANTAAAQMDRLIAHLRELQAKYTEKHPDILLAKKAIKDLEKEVAEADKEPAPGAPSSPPAQGSEGDFNPQAAFTKEMEGQLSVTENEIQNLKKEESKIRANIVTYQGRVENAPLHELMITNLSRGYETAKENYRRLLEKSEQAQQAENLEKRQKGEQFRLIDPARVPEKPIQPNIFMVLFGGLALGIFSGCGLAIFKEFTDRSFRDARDMEAALGIKVLANIPKFAPKSA